MMIEAENSFGIRREEPPKMHFSTIAYNICGIYLMTRYVQLCLEKSEKFSYHSLTLYL